MPSSNRLYQFAVGGCLAAVLLTTGTYAQGISDNESASENSQIGHDESQKRLEKAILGIARAIEASTSKNEAEEKQRAQREAADLRAQRRMAKWAKWVFWSTFGAAIVSLVGVGLLIRTLRLTSQSTLAAVRQADAAQATERAHVEIETSQLNWTQVGRTGAVLYDKPLGHDIDCRLRLKNYGRTLAILSQCRAELFFGEQLPNRRIFQYQGYWGGDHIIEGQASFNGMPVIEGPRTLTDAEATRAESDQESFGIFVFGYIRYRDVFNNWRERGFARRFSSDGSVAINDPEYDYERAIVPDRPSWFARFSKRLGLAT